jgi:virginiamycin B lyase
MVGHRRSMARGNFGLGRAVLAALLLDACGSGLPSAALSTPSDGPSPTASGAAASALPASTPGSTVPGGQSVPGDSVAAVDARTGELIRVIPVGPDPKLIASAGGQVWTLNLGDGSLSRIDPTSLTATSMRLDGDSVGMTSDGHDLWVTHAGRFLTRVDGATGLEEHTVTLADEPIFGLRDAGFLAVSDGVAWITVPVLGRAIEPQTLWRVDTETGQILGTYPLAHDPLTPIVSDGVVWVPILGSNGVLRLDPASGDRLTTKFGEIPVFVASGEGSIWVVLEFGARVMRLAPPDGSVLAEIKIGSRGRGIAVGGSAVWAATEAGITELDPATNTVRRMIALVEPEQHGQGPSAIAWFADIVWVPIE